MKRIILLTLLVVAGTMIIWSQVPQAMNYKAVAKDDWGVALPNKTITLRFSILQGSETGAVVYQETHTTATNKFGLIDVEIGKGTPVIGFFDLIVWSTGIYYIQIEMDPNGGTNFRLEDPAHQLLSVPYALYAETSGSSNFSETDPFFSSSPSSSIMSTEINNWNAAFGWGNHANEGYLKSFVESDPIFLLHPAHGISSENINNWNAAYGWGNHLGLYKPDDYVPEWDEITNKPTFATVATSGSYNDLNNKPITDGSETKVTAGTNVTITGVGTEADPYTISSTGGGSGSVHYIGESYGGGIVFYVYDNGLHGLIAATADQSTGIRWYGGSYTNTRARADGVGAGLKNTAIIIANQGPVDGNEFAATVCNEYSVTVGGVTYGDWYLPSMFELNLLYMQKTVVGGFTIGFYWSSTENNNTDAWYQNFYSGYQGDYDKNLTTCVRAVRAF